MRMPGEASMDFRAVYLSSLPTPITMIRVLMVCLEDLQSQVGESYEVVRQCPLKN